MRNKAAALVVLATVMLMGTSVVQGQLADDPAPSEPVVCEHFPGCGGFDMCRNAFGNWSCDEIYCGSYEVREIDGELVVIFVADGLMDCCDIYDDFFCMVV